MARYATVTQWNPQVTALSRPPPLAAAASFELGSAAAERVGWGFMALSNLALSNRTGG